MLNIPVETGNRARRDAAMLTMERCWGFLVEATADWMERLAVRMGLVPAKAVVVVPGDGRGVKGVK